jgi:hypothetical protein
MAFWTASLRVDALLEGVGELAEVEELEADDLIVLVEGHA